MPLQLLVTGGQVVKRTRIDHALKDPVPGQRLLDARPAGRGAIRPVADNEEPDAAARLREDWFDRTFQQVRGFLDEMFR